MSRDTRALMAKGTVAICDAGFYTAPSGATVSIKEALDHAKQGTLLYSPEHPPVPPTKGAGKATRFEARNETTFAALARLGSNTRDASSRGHLACLNFASAKNPGGGFLTGSLAQEEALACASGLYPCLLTAPEYYERNRVNRSALYLDLVIFSPHVPFFRDDRGVLLEQPLLASVITAPAPNTGVVAQTEPKNLSLIESALRRRARLVLDIAVAHQVDRLVLGAWGCGVFRNDPQTVAAIFAELLQPPGTFANVFAEVVFAVYDRSPDARALRSFASVLC